MAKKTQYDTILTEKKGSILWLSFNRPGRMNAFNLDMIEEVSTAVDEADADEDVRCILVKGEGDRAFSVGADLTMFTGLDAESAIATSEQGQRLMGKIEAASKPFVAAIHGFCLGGGLEFALACDFRITAESASLGSPEINLGIIPGWGGTQRLPRLIGLAKAKELVLLGDRISAEDALKIGLVHKVVSLDKLYEEAEAFLEFQKKEFERVKELHDNKHATDQQFTSAQYQLAAAHAKYDAAKKRLENATLRAPFYGILTDRYVEIHFQDLSIIHFLPNIAIIISF